MAGQSVGQVQLDLLLNSSAFRSQLQGAVNQAVSQTSSGISSRVSSTFSKLGKLAIAAFSVKAITGFISSSIELGSTLQEIQNVVDVTFPNMSKQVDEWAKNAMKNFGLSETAAKKYMGTLGNMAKGAGFTEQEAFNMSTTLTGLAGDVASFYNLTADEAVSKIKAVFSGETEGMRTAFGVDMTTASLDEFALAKGYNKTTKEMTKQEVVALRYAYVQERLKDSIGDFIRTEDSWANQTKILSLQWEQMKANLGQAFISVLTPVIKGLNLLVEKLVQASAAFRDFVQSIFGAQEAASNGSVSQLGEDAESAEDSLSGATGAAQKLKKSLMGFDNLNVLPDSSDTGAGAGASNIETNTTANKSEDKDTKDKETAIDRLIAKMKELGSIAKEGFLTGFGGQNTQQTVDNLKSIGEGLKEVGTDAQVVGAAQSFIDNIVLSLGTAAGAISSVGVTIGNLLTGSLSKALGDRKEDIKADLIDLFSIGDEISIIAADWSTAFADILSVFGGDNATGLGSNILKTIYDICAAITQLKARISRDFLAFITTPIVENTEEIKTALDGLLGNFNTVFGSISNVVKENTDKLIATYDEHIKPFIDSLTEGITEIVNTFLTQWNTYMQPVLDEIVSNVSEMWEEYLSPIIGKVIEIVGKVADALKGLWENILQPIVNFMVSILVPIISRAIHDIWNVVSVISNSIMGVIDGLLTAIGGIIDFVAGVFTGDWERAWNGVKDIFGGIWDALAVIIKTPINLIIGMLNNMIDGINNLNFTMPEWVPIVGGKSLGFTIPEIPMLAEGGYVGPDAPQLAVVGDNKHHGEIVAPENKLNEAVAANVRPVLTAIQQLMNVLVSQGQSGGDITIPIYLDGSLLDEYVVTAQDRRTLRSGGLA